MRSTLLPSWFPDDLDILMVIIRAVLDADLQKAAAYDEQLPSAVQRKVLHVSLVNPHWNEATSIILHGTVADFIAAREVKVLKQKARALDLSPIRMVLLSLARTLAPFPPFVPSRTPAVCCPPQFFLRQLEDKWGHLTIKTPLEDEDSDGDDFEDAPFLDALYSSHFQGRAHFARAVEAEYKQFLVVKAIETKAPTDLGTTAWGVKCQPSQMLDVFWHSELGMLGSHVCP